MSRRLALVVAVLALAVPPAVGPGLADPGPTEASRPAAGSAGVLTELNLTPAGTTVLDGTPTGEGTTLSTPTLSTPTSTITGDDLLGDGTVDETTDELDDAVGGVEDETSALAGTLSGAVSTDGALEVDGLGSVAADLDGTAGLDGAATGTPTGSGAADDGSTPAAGAAGGDPGDGGVPVDPLVGGALLGGVAVTVGLVARQLATGAASPGLADTLAGARTHVRLRAAEAVAGWRDRVGPLVAPFGYQRYDDSDPLEHAGRARLYEHVRDRPGTHLAALGDAADLPLSTARYHLRILEYEGLVRSEKRSGRRRFLPPDVDSDALAAALADDATATVLRSLVEDGPSSVSELAERLDRDPSTVSHHLARLANDGLVDRERRGRAVVSSASPSVEAALRRDGLAERAPNPANA